jgi:DNA-binding transcriptional ArsR family regulator
MTKPSISHHFNVLKEADLITARREGQQLWYGLNTTVVQDLFAWAMGPGRRGPEEDARYSEMIRRYYVAGVLSAVATLIVTVIAYPHLPVLVPTPLDPGG